MEQSEREELRTRIITNYNHSHALSMHYYEVVQIYRVAVEVSKQEPCLFVPMTILDFEQNPELIVSYRSTLAQFALTEDVRQQIRNFERDTDRGLFVPVQSVSSSAQDYLDSIPDDTQRETVANWLNNDLDAYLSEEINNYENIGVQGSHKDAGWRIPVGAELVGVSLYDEAPDEVTQATIQSLTIVKSRGTREEITNLSSEVNDVVPGIQVSGLQALQIQIETPNSNIFTLVMPRLHFRYGSDEFTLSFFGLYRGDSRTLLLGQFYGSTSGNQLGKLLNEDRLYYSQRIYENLSPSAVALLLSNFTYQGQRVIEVIDPVPLLTHGNYLVFRYFGETDEDEVDNQALQEFETFVPLPTGGVFAEAVLGRFNASEKLDITRFWDWQESPIPHQAPDIAPLQSGSRVTDPDLEPGRLDAPIINIQNPQPLPDPTATTALLNALTTANLFRDMSGLQQAAQIVQQGITSTSQSAVSSAQIAAENLRTFINVLRDVAVAYLTGQPTGSEGGKSNSTAGALINHGEKIDSKNNSGQSGSSSNTSTGSQPSSTNGSNGTSGGSGTTGGGQLSSSSGSSSTPRSLEVEAFRDAVNPGNSATNATLQLVEFVQATGGSGSIPYWVAFKRDVIRIAVGEWERWERGRKKETQMVPVVENYWRVGVGKPMPSIETAWSAAFISWVMRTAGAQDLFEYSERHTDYVGWAKNNRINASPNPFWAYNITEVAPEPGDILCKERSNSGLTYENVNDGRSRASHCDIVVAAHSGEIETIGGNLSNSVRKDTVRIRSDGTVNTNASGQDVYYAVLRIRTDAPTPPPTTEV